MSPLRLTVGWNSCTAPSCATLRAFSLLRAVLASAQSAAKPVLVLTLIVSTLPLSFTG